MTEMVPVQLDKELVARIAETLEEYSKENDFKVLNSAVVLAMQYVTACVQRVGMEDKELN